MKRSVACICISLFVLCAVAGQEKPDALKLYRNGRNLEAIGRMEDAKALYRQSIDVCMQDLVVNPKNMDAYTVRGWALIRLEKYQETIDVCLEALKISADFRIIETVGEAYFYQGNYKDSLKNMEKYIEAAPRGERISTAYFFVGEIYRIGRKFNRAEIAYSAAVYLEPAISLWWYRLGAVRETVGESKPAIEAYKRALNLRPDYKPASEALTRLRA